ncbi:MAG TPA: O-antigen ligase family protein [Tepidisphaeraceae bacterium]
MSGRRDFRDQSGSAAAFGELAAPPTRFDIAIEWVLGALLIFAPLALGAVEAWSETVVTALAAAMVVLLVAKLVVHRETTRFAWTWAYVPMVLFAALLAVQLVPLPAGWVAAVSPQTLKLKSQLLDGATGAQAALARQTTLSFYPHATAHDLRIVLVACAIFVCVLNVYRRPEQVKRLLAVVAASGAAVAVLALMQDLSGAKEIYWSIYTGRAVTSGPFVNYNNFSQFINLSVGAGLALMLVLAREIERGDTGTGSWGAAERKTRWLWWLGAMITAGVVAIFLSTSRMGVLSTLAAGLVAGLLIQFRRPGKGGKSGSVRGWVLVPIAMAVFVTLLWAGFDKVYDRLATLGKIERTEGGRWQTLQDLPQIYRQFPLLGIGSGAHETFYPMFDRHGDGHRTAQVENDYAQVLEETGIVGAGLVVAFLLALLANVLRGVRARSIWTRVAMIGLSYGLLAVLIHSASDFGQHLASIAALSAVTCGLILTLGRSAAAAARSVRASKTQAIESPREPSPAVRPALGGGGFLPLRLAGGALGLLVIGWALWRAGRTWLAESHWEQAQAAESWLARNDWDGDDADYDRLIGQADQAFEAEDDNVQYRHGALIYRWRRLTRERDPETGALLLSQADLEGVKHLIADLHASRALCPSFGGNLSMAGQLERFVLDDPTGAAHIREGYRLSPLDPTTCFAAGLLDAVEGKWDDSVEKFRRVSDTMFADVVEIYLHQVNRPDLALAVAGDDATKLFRLADVLQNEAAAQAAAIQPSGASAAAIATGDLKTNNATPTTAPTDVGTLAQQAKAQAIARIKAKAAEPDAPAATLAAMASVTANEGDHATAADYYRRALAIEYGQVGWRLGLARSLAELGEVRQAIAEARVCLRLRPQDYTARRIIQDMSVLPGAIAAGDGDDDKQPQTRE